MNMGLILGGVVGVAALGLVVLVVLTMFVLRRVVPTNMVHIVQSAKKQTSYGAGQSAGNVYYEIPSFIPMFGVVTSKFAVSNFDVGLDNYAAYDAGRLPFVVDVRAFFAIKDSDLAAKKVSSFDELVRQLQEILRGSVRRVLAEHKLEDILGMRSELGRAFTEQVDAQLAEWGVQTVKTIEFMDMRDAGNSTVIHDIMAKDQSRIAMESRVKVAENSQLAQTKEIEAQRIIEVNKQEAARAIGQATAEKEKAVGIADEKARQEVAVEEAVTAERDMAVRQVTEVRTAEIAKNVAAVQAEQNKQVQVIAAQAEREQTTVVAEGVKAAALLDADGITAVGVAKGAAEQALLMAPVNAQVVLAKEIGGNKEYQTYLVTVEQIKANQAVGVAQAAALSAANIKVIANGGTVEGGITSIGELLSSKGGQALGAMMSGLAQTPEGEAVVKRVAKGKGA